MPIPYFTSCSGYTKRGGGGRVEDDLGSDATLTPLTPRTPLTANTATPASSNKLTGNATFLNTLRGAKNAPEKRSSEQTKKK